MSWKPLRGETESAWRSRTRNHETPMDSFRNLIAHGTPGYHEAYLIYHALTNEEQQALLAYTLEMEIKSGGGVSHGTLVPLAIKLLVTSDEHLRILQGACQHGWQENNPVLYKVLWMAAEVKSKRK